MIAELARHKMPPRIAALPRDRRGYPVPRFVHWHQGEPKFQIIDPRHMAACVKHNRCWICGQPLGRHKAFSVGPMCVINRISAEPPAHLDCAEYAARVCPFLARPHMKRPPLPKIGDGKYTVAGEMDPGNPGGTCIWIARDYKPFKAGSGVLFTMGEPDEIRWFAGGEPASLETIADIFEAGAGRLRIIAEREGGGAVAEFECLLAIGRRVTGLQRAA